MPKHKKYLSTGDKAQRVTVTLSREAVIQLREMARVFGHMWEPGQRGAPPRNGFHVQATVHDVITYAHRKVQEDVENPPD